MWDDDENDLLLQNLSTLLNTAKTGRMVLLASRVCRVNISFLLFSASGLSPLYLLRPFLVHLRDPNKLDTVRSRFLEVLQTRAHEDFSKAITVPSCEMGLTDDLRLRFKFSLSTNLFGWDDLLSLRMRLSLADFAWVSIVFL